MSNEKIKYKGCKHLDYDEEKYPSCKLLNLYENNYCWERINPDGNKQKCQFCGEGRGRINGVFDCINEGEMHCYQPQED